jgi:gluconate 2-dehydrogenase alpha chain
VPADTPRWGLAWKQATVKHYNHTSNVSNQGSNMAHRANYLDLDPTYRDVYGRPLLRMTFDFLDNEQKQMRGLNQICAQIGRAMGGTLVEARTNPIPYSIVPYQSTHNTGGVIMGADPKTSVLNKYCQVWDVPNVFVTGACVFPQNAGKNPTGPVGALAYWIADALKDKYLKRPGALVPV